MHSDAITDILIVLTAALVIVPLLHRAGVSSVLGYLAVGMLIGPSGLKAIDDPEQAAWLAELGVVFMLFAIGLELPLERLKTMRFYVFGLGGAQMGVTMLVIGLIAILLGMDPAAAIVIGGILALSSTATVLKLLIDRGEAAARFGRIAVAVLLFQDLAVVPMLALIPLLGAEGGSLWFALGLAAVKAALALGLITLAGRFLIRPLFRQIAGTGNSELFTAASLFILLGLGWITREAGMSMGLGAFLAGMLLAGTPYRHQIEADIQPFRGLLLGLFFVTVGMTFDLAAVAANIVPIIGITLIFVLIKVLLTALVARAFGLKSDTGLRAALILAQGSEFGFVLTSLAGIGGILSGGTILNLNAAIVLSIALTPALATLGRYAASYIRDRRGRRASSLADESEHLAEHVLVAGYGRVGQAICRLLDNAEIGYVVLDLNVQRVIRARARGLPVYFGDASRIDVLRAAGVERASLAVIAIDSPAMAERMAAALHEIVPNLVIVARAWDAGHAQRLAHLGVNEAIPEDIEIGLGLGSAMLRRLGRFAPDVDRYIAAFRAEQQTYGSAEPDKTTERITKD
ncbi:monovalent cation:proton antiporter-2 (CPA2) family protein [Dongia mobilis]|uniref:monovalent cation:proton antiporter-2 (CPA2) family protein n=1 Tax=Dongia sp. TaxID=1977262 RepID=UPI0026F2E012